MLRPQTRVGRPRPIPCSVGRLPAEALAQGGGQLSLVLSPFFVFHDMRRDLRNPWLNFLSNLFGQGLFTCHLRMQLKCASIS